MAREVYGVVFPRLKNCKKRSPPVEGVKVARKTIAIQKPMWNPDWGCMMMMEAYIYPPNHAVPTYEFLASRIVLLFPGSCFVFPGSWFHFYMLLFTHMSQ